MFMQPLVQGAARQGAARVASFWGELNDLFTTGVETSAHGAKASRWRNDSMNLGDG